MKIGIGTIVGRFKSNSFTSPNEWQMKLVENRLSVSFEEFVELIAPSREPNNLFWGVWMVRFDLLREKSETAESRG